MKKLILILDGTSIGKTKFTQVLMGNGFWIWNTNHKNLLSMLMHKLGWNGERNKNYYEFIEQFSDLSNKYFDSQKQYVCEMCEKFIISSKAEDEERAKGIEILAHIEIFHNLNEYVKSFIKKEYSARSILISEADVQDDQYDFTLNCKNENYEINVLNLIKSLI